VMVDGAVIRIDNIMAMDGEVFERMDTDN